LTVTKQLKQKYSTLWNGAVDHKFITELGDGTLSRERFSRYFEQDYIFINDLAKMAGIAVAKAPSNKMARPVEEFLNAILGAEDALFIDAFRTLGINETQYLNAQALPTTLAFGDFLVRLAYEGSFREICTAMLVTEGVYLAWGERLISEKANPAADGSELGKFYQGWIDLHNEGALGPIVRHQTAVVDQAMDIEMSRLESIFEQALRYEVAFWDMAYNGET
jgi:thiaminase/transcriptional activator TenA